MSLIFPKKEILYAPMLGTLGGGSARGFGRGGGGGPAVGGILYETTGSFIFTVPAGVSELCMVCIGGGGGGSYDHDGTGGGGGGLGWRNSYAVSEGQQFEVFVGTGGGDETRLGGNAASTSLDGDAGQDSYFATLGGSIITRGGGGNGGIFGGATHRTVYGGGYVGDGGGAGGGMTTSYANGGGGAGGYSGQGGNANENGNAYDGQGGGGGGGVRRDNWYTGAGGGTGIYGQGANGAGGTNNAGTINGIPSTAADMLLQCGKSGSGGQDPQMITNGAGYALIPRGGTYGGGGGAGYNSTGNYIARAGHGAVRIIWGEGRAFPSTNVDLASSTDGETII